jgi:DNA-binding transcriptional LysR family regulator
VPHRTRVIERWGRQMPKPRDAIAVVGMTNQRLQTVGQLVWDDLRYFLAVCRYNSVSAAAQQLSVSHPTVSRRVARLEEVLNAKLFEHQKTGYVPTLVGTRLLHAVENIEASITTCQAENSDSNQSLNGVVRVGAPDGFGSHFLASHLAALCCKNPGLQVELIVADRELSLAQREIDIAITLARPTSGSITGKKLTDLHLGLYASPKYLARRPEVRSVHDLDALMFVGGIEGLVSPSLRTALPSAFREVAPGFKSNNLFAQLHAIAEGEGIGVLPMFIAAKMDGIVQVLPAQVVLQSPLYILIHDDNKRLARIRGVADFICDSVHKNSRVFAGLRQVSNALLEQVSEVDLNPNCRKSA